MYTNCTQKNNNSKKLNWFITFAYKRLIKIRKGFNQRNYNLLFNPYLSLSLLFPTLCTIRWLKIFTFHNLQSTSWCSQIQYKVYSVLCLLSLPLQFLYFLRWSEACSPLHLSGSQLFTTHQCPDSIRGYSLKHWLHGFRKPFEYNDVMMSGSQRHFSSLLCTPRKYMFILQIEINLRSIKEWCKLHCHWLFEAFNQIPWDIKDLGFKGFDWSQV